MNNLLTQYTLGYSVNAVDSIKLNWIGELIKILIDGIGIVGVGIIVFTLILKCIVLPLDIYSRIKTKKQSLIMERMRPQMEKLQKQYANDKAMYNQKVMELQKKSGYSMFGACLPMIVSLVIFIIVFNAFSTVSQFYNLENYNNLVKAYNGVVSNYVVDENTPNGFLTAVNEDGSVWIDGGEGKPYDYVVDFGAFANYYNAEKQTSKTEEDVFLALADEYKSAHSGYDGAFDKNIVNQKNGEELTDTAASVRVTLVNFYLEEPAAKAAADYYAEHNNSFLWVKNLWYPDSTLNKEIPDFAKFKSTVTQANIGDDYADSYARVTAGLETQKNAYNGYYILIVLSIGLMLLQQFIMMRSNKAVNELSTVDGSGARTNKWMMIMMPIIYGIFSFFYSASFSLYMITNTIFGIITTLVINKCVDVWFKKKEEQGKLDEILQKKKFKKNKKGGKAYAAGRNRRK